MITPSHRCRIEAGILSHGRDFDIEVNPFVFESTQKCDVDIRRDWYGNVATPCGTATFEDIVVRMTKGSTTLAPQTMQIEVSRASIPSTSAPPSPHHQALPGDVDSKAERDDKGSSPR